MRMRVEDGGEAALSGGREELVAYSSIIQHGKPRHSCGLAYFAIRRRSKSIIAGYCVPARVVCSRL